MIVTPPAFEPVARAPEAADSHTFLFRGAEILVRDVDHAPVDAREAAALLDALVGIEPVGLWSGRLFRSGWVDADAAAPAGFAFRGLRTLFGRVDDSLVALAGRAFQLVDWARTHRFCGACGRPMQRDPEERVMRCACGHSAWPRVAPAMMTLVKRGPAILLARNIAAPPGGRMSALAGFVEPGESVEDAVHREVEEEVGLRVKDLRYFGSQSWPFPHSLMIAFTAEYAGGDIRCDPREIAEAHWFGPGDRLPEIPPPFSISYELITANLPR